MTRLPALTRSSGERRGARPARRLAAAAAGLALAVAPVLAASPADARPVAPAPTKCQTIDYDRAAVIPLATTTGVPGTVLNQLVVSGTTPYTNITVTLEPLVYVRQPEYWGIEVVGCTTGDVGAPALTPYKASYRFVGSLGSCGIEVIGATKTTQFTLAPCAKPVA